MAHQCFYLTHVMPSETCNLMQSRVCSAGLRLQCKYKGHSNRNTQIRASFSADGSSIICGSDDGHVYIWSTDSTSSSSQAASKKVCCCHSQLWKAVAKWPPCHSVEVSSARSLCCGAFVQCNCCCNFQAVRLSVRPCFVLDWTYTVAIDTEG